MSLSSAELNYLVWRYLQESGAELAAFALLKHAQCLESPLEKLISPGTLVSLVQRGILYSIAQSSVLDEAPDDRLHDTAPDLSLLANAKAESLQDALAADLSNESMDHNSQSHTPHEGDCKKDLSLEILSSIAQPFTTTVIQLAISFAPSIACSWHPQSNVFAYGTSESSLIVNAMNNTQIAELVTIPHPLSSPTLQVNVSPLAWSPQGSTIASATGDGDIRAWAPDGTLRNVAKLGRMPITHLSWSPEGTYLLAVDSHAHAVILDGTTLDLIKSLSLAGQDPSPADACWLSDHTLAVSSPTGSICIFSISDGTASPVVEITGHTLPVTLLAYDSDSRLLASCADTDHRILIWTRHLTRPARELPVGSLPIIAFTWVAPSILLSTQMDASVSIWDAENGKQLGLTSLFRESRNFSTEDVAGQKLYESVQVFDAVLSPNKHLLAVADECARVTVWDVDWSRYANLANIDSLRCVGIFDPGQEAALDVSQSGSFGVCDMAWDVLSLTVCVSYTGANSVIFKVDTEQQDVTMQTEP